MLHWRHPLISEFYSSKHDVDGMISTVLQLSESYDFTTLEQDTLRISLFAKNKESLAELEPGNLYNLRIRIDTQTQAG